MKHVEIDRGLFGYPEVALGGYVAALLAREIEGSCRVQFHAPTPLATPLALRSGEQGASLESLAGEVRYASARSEPVAVTLPFPPALEEARRASDRYRASESRHPLCFGCGPGRAEGDGLRVFVERVPGSELLAGVWIPDAAFANDDGRVTPEFLRAALDCPGGRAATVLRPGNVGAVTASMDVALHARPAAGAPCLVLAWLVREAGRKTWAGSALTALDGEPYATAESLWIAPRAPSGSAGEASS